MLNALATARVPSAQRDEPPVSYHRIACWLLLDEHRTDLARLGGYLAGTSQAREAATEPVRHRLWHRLPWLLLGLVGAMAATVLVGAFEAQLDAKVLRAFFVPGVV